MADMVKPDTRRKLAKPPDARGNESRLWRGSTRCHHRQHRGVPFDVAKGGQLPRLDDSRFIAGSEIFVNGGIAQI
jgi:hypothetical protein